jgi:Holliday junction resolvasome RuvABC endonuclease subunit
VAKGSKPRKSAKQERREAWGKVEGRGPAGQTRILGLDISSTNIGLCLLRDRDPYVVKHWHFAGTDRDARLREMVADLHSWIYCNRHLIDGLAYEGPAPNAKSGGWMNSVTQAQAIGVVKSVWLRNLHPLQAHNIIEVPIQHGKSALAGYHKAEKEQMIDAARLIAPGFEWNEHTADAFGIGLAAYTYLEQERQLAEYARRMKEEAGDVI